MGDGGAGAEPRSSGGGAESVPAEPSVDHGGVVGDGDDSAGEVLVAVDNAVDVSCGSAGVGLGDDSDSVGG